MQTYKVFAKITSWAYVYVDADNPEEAMRIADDLDGGEFKECPDAEWETVEAIEE